MFMATNCSLCRIQLKCVFFRLKSDMCLPWDTRGGDIQLASIALSHIIIKDLN